jgi:hypothetical protein
VRTGRHWRGRFTAIVISFLCFPCRAGPVDEFRNRSDTNQIIVNMRCTILCMRIGGKTRHRL